MARVRVKVNHKNIEALLHDPALARDLGKRAGRVEAACNEQSSWGGYESEVDETPDGPVARVWDYGNPTTDTRRDRLLRNLGAGK